MSRTDKTDPHRVKVDRYGEHYWMSIHHCRCVWCKAGNWENAPRRRRERKLAARNWEREYA